MRLLNLASLLFLLTSPAALRAGEVYPDVPIPYEQRVWNYTGGACCFVSIETLANYHGIEQLYGLSKRYNRPSGPNQICSVLNERGVSHTCRYPSDDRTATIVLLQKACYEGYGALIGINGNHACVLIGLDNQTARIISNNNRTKEVQTIPTRQFLNMFHGWATVIWKD